MILSNTAIFAALDEGRLVIDPQPSPRQPEPGRKSPYQTTAVDLRLGNEISHFDGEFSFDINLSRGGLAGLFGSHSKRRQLSAEQPFVLEPRRLVLGKPLERVALPLMEEGPSLAARVEGKSSYARCGLLVHFTAPTVHAGWDGTITLEFINLGPCNIALYPGAPICQLIIEQVEGAPTQNDSQFQNQSRPGGKV